MMHRDEGCNPMDGGRCGEGTVGGVGRSVNVKVGGKCLYE